MRLFFALLLASGTALADDGSILRCRDIGDAAKRLACYDAIAIAITPGAKPVAATPAQARHAAEKSFGLVKKEDEIEAIQSHIPGSFDGWESRQHIKLANGQVWQIVDDSTGVVYGKDLKVTVERGAMGAMYLQIEGTRKSPKVRRVQ
ncbi:hypothetical protein [Massilia cavernae]|uniref:Uncharacterized protein n=1 Tax=Massilia cavernae TaxID=2320864 RepID=A0A418XAK9_9BURK|nr:hypothetical protein [Massilia cavernae]RJG09536.1 hypothetical protein D3872_22255 [Massilia cavernae]